MKRFLGFGKKEGQGAAAEQAKKASITFDKYKENIEKTLKKIDQNFENIRQDEEYQRVVTKYNKAYDTWKRQTTPSSEMGLIRAAHEIIFFYVQNIINPALEQVGALMKIQPVYSQANKQEEVDLSKNLSKMLIAINREIVTYNRQLGELHKSATTSKKYIEKYNKIKKEHFQLRKKDITEEHDFEEDILKNLKLIIRARANKQGIDLKALQAALAAEAQAVAARTSPSSNPPGAGGDARKSPSPHPIASNAGWEAGAGLSDSQVNDLVAGLEAEVQAGQAQIDEELKAEQAKNEELAGKLTKPMHSNQDSLEREVEEELAAMEAAELAAKQQAAELAAQQQAAAGGDAQAVAAKTSPRQYEAERASSPGSESSRTESAADSLLAEQADEIEARAAGRRPARASSPGGVRQVAEQAQSIMQAPAARVRFVRSASLTNLPEAARKAEEERARKAAEQAQSIMQAPAARVRFVRSASLTNLPEAARKAEEERARKAAEEAARKAEEERARKAAEEEARQAAMRRQTRYEVIESINEKQIYFLINIAKGLQGKNKEEVTKLLDKIAKEKPELYNKVKKDDKELGPAYSKHFIDEFYKDENSQSTQFIEALIDDDNELRVIKTIFSTIKTRQQPIVHRDGPDQGASDEQGRAWTNCIFGGGARSKRPLHNLDIFI